MKMPSRINRDEEDKKYPKTNKGINFDENKDLCEFVFDVLSQRKSVEKEFWGGMYISIELLDNKVALYWRDSEILVQRLDTVISEDINLTIDNYRDSDDILSYEQELKKLKKTVSSLKKYIKVIERGQ